MTEPTFKIEADLCAAFIKALPKGWTAYAETGGFDILLVRDEDGFQIGIEAKLKLNAKVISQVYGGMSPYSAIYPGPDCRAVLVPDGCSRDLVDVCAFLGIEVITCQHPDGQYWRHRKFYPDLPKVSGFHESDGSAWRELVPAERIKLPEWVPDTKSGDKCPVTLTDWKIRAIKVLVLLEKTGFLTREDFKDLGISITRWLQGGSDYRWLKTHEERGKFVANRCPDLRAQHPVNFEQIAADFDKWNPRLIKKDKGLPIYQCVGCGGVYLVPVTECDCAVNVEFQYKYLMAHPAREKK